MNMKQVIVISGVVNIYALQCAGEGLGLESLGVCLSFIILCV